MDEETKIGQYIVSTWLSGDARGFDDSTDLHQTGVLDSFSTLSLIAFLEGEFRIQIDPADVNGESFKTVKAIAALVRSKPRA